MKNEIKNCQNCKQDFEITSDDFSFYEKIKVPPPTWCPKCRRQRRMAWRNERILYRHTCGLCNKNIITMYHPDSPFPVYCRDCWYSDQWDATSYGLDYDFSRPFFEQYKKLSDLVPRLSLWQRNVINCDYSNMTGESKNVYLSVSVIKGSENVFYSKSVDNSKDIMDSLNVIPPSENLYQNIEAQANYNSQYLLLCRSVLDSYYCIDCANCSNCFMSYNLRNKQFCIRNQQYTREGYFKELEKINLKSQKVRSLLYQEFKNLINKSIFKFANMTKCVDSTGNNLLNTKNAKNCFSVYNVENVKNCFRAFLLKDSMDVDFAGWSELTYEYTTGAKDLSNVKFSYSSLESLQNADYTEGCRVSKNLFGCISMRNSENVILNKKYSKEEYMEMREKIIKHMNDMPYIDKMGRVYKYGEFFPLELSHVAYNESQAQEFVYLEKLDAQNQGFIWHEPVEKNINITIANENIPDNLEDVDESIKKEVIGCAHGGLCKHSCTTAFRITDYEFSFYKKNQIPLPILCPNCRYHERCELIPGFDLSVRTCMKEGCQNEFETTYAPDRPEIVYCEKCYQQEVY